MKRFFRILLVGLIIVVPAYWWLLVESGEPSTAFVLDIEACRTLASNIAGDKPTGIRVERVTKFRFPEVAVRAGAWWNSVDLPVFAYQLQFQGWSAVVDTAMDAKVATDSDAVDFDEAAFARVQRAMEQARWVVVTHEHFDHIGGLASHPRLDELAGSVFRLTKEQLTSERARKPYTFTPSQLQRLPTIPLTPLVPLAPGVVLIRSPGHTPGMLMVYVQQADGEEFLFVSDVAWRKENWEQVRQRARLVTSFFLNEDREGVLSQLKAIHQAASKFPRLHVVPGHDERVIDALVDQRLLTRSFSE